MGVLKSFPLDLLNSKKDCVAMMQTVWIPKSSSDVSQHPFLKKPVVGWLQHIRSGFSSTFNEGSIWAIA